MNIVVRDPSEKFDHGRRKKGRFVKNIVDGLCLKYRCLTARAKNVASDPAVSKGNKHPHTWRGLRSKGQRELINKGAVDRKGNGYLNVVLIFHSPLSPQNHKNINTTLIFS
jgi:hypothetical protein